MNVVRSLALVFALASCVAPRDGQFLCGEPDFECPPGMVCAGDGVCREGGAPDAGPTRDAGRAADAAIDAGSCADRGAPDGDGDGACDADDCDAIDPEVHPGAAETCGGDAEARDDDCDGAIDESCPFELGLVHAPITLHRPDRSHFGPELGDDGLRVYVTASDLARGGLYFAERTALDRPFGPLMEVPGTDTDVVLTLATISGDELEVFAQGALPAQPSRIWHATRLARSDPFGAFEVIATTQDAAGSQIHPTISRDGLELYYVHDEGGARELRRVTRAARSGTFGPHEVTVASGDPEFPRLSADGRTLRFTRGGALVFLARSAADAPFAGEPSADPIAAREPAAILPFHHPRARELWFTLAAPAATIDPRAPLPASTMRAQVCRGLPCAPPEPIACDTTSGHVRSEDGLRCFWLGPSEGNVGFTASHCTSDGGHLATLHTEAEMVAAAPLIAGGARWIGLNRTNAISEFSWQYHPSEPFLWSGGSDPRWAAGEPSADVGDYYAIVRGDGWDTIGGTSMTLLPLCERETWPVW